jgi:hypothetical protein
MKSISLQLTLDSLTYFIFKSAPLKTINLTNYLNYLKVSIRIFCMQNLAFTIQKLMPPFKEPGHD